MNSVPIKDRSCFDCIHANVEDAYPSNWDEEGSPPSALCRFKEHECLQEQEGTSAAQFCPSYAPHMVKQCHLCGAPMNIPERQALVVPIAFGEDYIYVCSSACEERAVMIEADRERVVDTVLPF